ncbi:hypothetical protein [Hyunsoonleella ulvae]|uniref:hypothetical protein n=1 Tax=Hyunsoonleella ulvae TaxID=2799948 RepID=UPI00193AC7AF|nr:hypothetical protein [Hyunsoonleella ulvae]
MLRSFILKIVLFACVFILAYIFMVDRLSKTYVDPHYYKFTQKSNNLILGLSRANEGISTYITDSELFNFKESNSAFVNFALNEAHFGSVYLNAIKAKISDMDNGIFIMSVSPGNFTSPKRFIKNEQITEFDKTLTIGKINNFTSNPNYNYIIKTYPASLYNALHVNEQWPNRISHENGWNEIRLNTKKSIITDKDIDHWKSLNYKFYEDKAKNEIISSYRKDYFIETIEFLKEKGILVLVRMPCDKYFLDFENNYWPNFNSYIDSISKAYNLKFLNYSETNNTYRTYDGSHFESNSAIKFTKVLCQDLKLVLKKSKARLNEK